MKTERVQAFSDGVFAVAITLLVLDLVPPAANTRDLLAALADRWPDFAAFGLSFLTIGIIWVNHHVVFDAVRRVDRPLLFLNLGLLMSVVLLPFSTSLFARFLAAGGSQSHVAAALFSGSLLLMSLWFDAAYAWIGAHPELRTAGPGATGLDPLAPALRRRHHPLRGVRGHRVRQRHGRAADHRRGGRVLHGRPGHHPGVAADG